MARTYRSGAQQCASVIGKGDQMKRRLIAYITAAILVLTLTVGYFVYSTPTAHAATIGGGGCASTSWVKKITTYHYTSETLGSTTWHHTEWIEIDGLYDGSYFCGQAKAYICRYADQYQSGEYVNSWYQLANGYTSTTQYNWWGNVSAYTTKCAIWNISMGSGSGQGVFVGARWGDQSSQEAEWGTSTAF